ncbi:MAG: hypothetical protein DMG12_27700 [Acidobacteria bacterium]|nr:MAG: hypothetical protein DMG12_27700 [Acidobacteriota bacterium]
MKRVVLFSLAGIWLLCNCSSIVWAQSTAQISGTVMDQSGAVLPGVEVTATETETGLTRSVVSNETGSYVLPNLPVGPYRLEAGLPGGAVQCGAGRNSRNGRRSGDRQCARTRAAAERAAGDGIDHPVWSGRRRRHARDESHLADRCHFRRRRFEQRPDVSARRGDTQRSLRQSESASSVSRCTSGVQGGNERGARTVWTAFRRRDECRDKIRHQ